MNTKKRVSIYLPLVLVALFLVSMAAFAAEPAAKVAVVGKHLPPAYTVAFSPDGKKLAVGGYKRVTVYDTETGKPLAQWVVGKDAIRSIAFSEDGKRLAAGGGVAAAQGSVAVVDAGNGKAIRTVGDHDDAVEGIAFAGNLLLSAADDETVAISDLATGKIVGTLREHVGRCLSVTVPSKTSDNDGGNIFVTGGADNMVKIWDAEKRRVVVNFDQATGPVWSVASFPRPGRFIAGSADGHLRWCNVYTEKERQLPNGDKEAIVPPQGEPQPRGGYIERDIMAHEGGVYSVAPAPNDQFIASGGADHKVVLWNLGGGKLREWTEAGADILGVAVSPDSKRVAAASLDGHTRVYDAEKGNLLWMYPPPPPPPPDPEGWGTGLSASYFNNVELSGEPVLKRTDTTVDYKFDPNVAPGTGVNKENFSIRWEGFYEAPNNGSYLFSTRSDDGVRLTVNGKLLIDNWTGHGTAEDKAKEPVVLKKGQRIPIKMEYFQGGGGAEIHLDVAIDGKPSEVIPKKFLFPLAPAKPAAPEKPAVSKPEPVVKPATAVKPQPKAKP